MAATTEQRSTVVGVFEDRPQADIALGELRQAGFREDQIRVEETRHCGGESQSDRTLVAVTVKADGRYDEATTILAVTGPLTCTPPPQPPGLARAQGQREL